jgi:UDP-3-O-[3-hydroxymyristoyl] glucosamine N-acyltransferase
MKLLEIAEALGSRCEGDGSLDIVRAAHPAEVEGPGDLALAMEKDLLALVPGSAAIAAVIADGAEVPPTLKGWIVVHRPRYAMAGLLDLFERPVDRAPGIHPTAAIDPTATLGANVSIGPFVSVGPRAVLADDVVVLANSSIGADARIGAGTLLHAGVRIGDRVVLGARCILQPNACVGNDGFSFVTPEPGSVESAKAMGQVMSYNVLIRRVNSIGTVIVGDDVEIGANSTIDRGTVVATRIGNGTKIDNLVQIGHNVEIGSNCMLCGHVGVAGSSKIGDRVVLAGQVGVADHITIGHDAVVGASSGVGTNIPPRTVYFGTPAQPKKQAFEGLKSVARVPRLSAEIKELKARLAELESRLTPAGSSPAED